MIDSTSISFTIFGSAVFTATLLALVYWRLGNGLAFKMYGVFMPITTITYLTALISERYHGQNASIDLINYGLAIVIVGGLAYLYRMIVKPLQEYSVNLQSHSSQLASNATQSASTAAEQSTMVTEVGATVEEISETSTAAADSAQNIVEVAAKALAKSREGQTSVKEALDIMLRISNVNRIVDTVSKFAEQSNLLALNASIEAAKAGEHGVGFAVVAKEVRNLAEQSNRATQEIREAIDLTSKGQGAIETVADVLRALTSVLEDTSDQSRRIAGTAHQQAAGLKQINEAVLSLRTTSQDSAASSKQIEQSSASLAEIGLLLQQFMRGNQANGTA
jgi:methyl-accepting chemotaxis protein